MSSWLVAKLLSPFCTSFSPGKCDENFVFPPKRMTMRENEVGPVHVSRMELLLCSKDGHRISY